MLLLYCIVLYCSLSDKYEPSDEWWMKRNIFIQCCSQYLDYKSKNNVHAIRPEWDCINWDVVLFRFVGSGKRFIDSPSKCTLPLQLLFVISLGDFTFWLRLSLSQFAERKYGLSTYLAKKWSDFAEPFAKPKLRSKYRLSESQVRKYGLSTYLDWSLVEIWSKYRLRRLALVLA